MSGFRDLATRTHPRRVSYGMELFEFEFVSDALWSTGFVLRSLRRKLLATFRLASRIDELFV